MLTFGFGGSNAGAQFFRTYLVYLALAESYFPNFLVHHYRFHQQSKLFNIIHCFSRKITLRKSFSILTIFFSNTISIIFFPDRRLQFFQIDTKNCKNKLRTARNSETSSSLHRWMQLLWFATKPYWKYFRGSKYNLDEILDRSHTIHQLGLIPPFPE